MEEKRLGIIWTSADTEVATHMVFMYTHNSKKRNWWQEVRLIVWGPSQKLLLENKELQERLQQMAADGVEIWACKGCSDEYGTSADLAELGLKVLYVGEPVSQMLQTGWKVLTF